MNDIESILKQYEPMINDIATRYANKNGSIILDKNDFSQQAYLKLIHLITQYPELITHADYVAKCINNDLNRLLHHNSSQLNITSDAIKLSKKIYHLQNNGLNSIEIQNILGISKQRYLEVKNILNRENLYNYIEYDTKVEYDIKELIDYLKSKLDNKNKILFEYYLQDKSIKQISDILGLSRETIRLRLISLFKELRSIYANI